MPIVAITCVWGRLDLAHDTIKHTRETLGIPVVACGSEGHRSRRIAERAGAHYIEHENRPLGAKWNAALAEAMTMDPDAVMVLGSDDIIPASTFRFLVAQSMHRPFVGLLDFIAYRKDLGEVWYWPGYQTRRAGEPVGSGRIIHGDVLRTMQGQLWAGDEEEGLDGSATCWLKAHGIEPHGVWGGRDTVVAVRAGENMTRWRAIAKTARRVDWEVG